MTSRPSPPAWRWPTNCGKQQLRVDLYPDVDRYGRQFQYAGARGIRYALLLGPNEIEQNAVAVKDLESGEQVEIARGEVSGWLGDRVAGIA